MPEESSTLHLNTFRMTARYPDRLHRAVVYRFGDEVAREIHQLTNPQHDFDRCDVSSSGKSPEKTALRRAILLGQKTKNDPEAIQGLLEQLGE